MQNLSIWGVVILALSLLVLNTTAGRPAIVVEDGPDLASLLGDEGAESDTDYGRLTVVHHSALLS